MADVPDTLVLERHRDLVGIRRVPWPRRVVIAVIGIAAVRGLLDVFGQRPGTSTAAAPAARLELYAPSHLRGGLLFSARFHLTASADLKKAQLVLDPGWLEGMAVNTIEPSPLGQASADGRLSLDLGHVPKGGSYLLFMQFQVNPTNLAWRRPATVTLLDGDRTILRLHHHFTIYP